MSVPRCRDRRTDLVCKSRFWRNFAVEGFYCQPGVEGAHEKGSGVEGWIGYFRRTHFTPVLKVVSQAELNELIE
ncbi:hypothetical protein C1I97_19120 [Streptomyces sp. NTH33]|uniref:hypothetical protein n=1 Tax=Streptomyces sp. NTH33 TaxID=1735453 RepID=UPI000DA934BB|nr:hypothetical protein [Streptomyces sp. NTH33]PZH04842.1 hypothetical protein C1I97_19120 [Streptomyces sp. NTH33]